MLLQIKWKSKSGLVQIFNDPSALQPGNQKLCWNHCEYHYITSGHAWNLLLARALDSAAVVVQLRPVSGHSGDPPLSAESVMSLQGGIKSQKHRKTRDEKHQNRLKSRVDISFTQHTRRHTHTHTPARARSRTLTLGHPSRSQLLRTCSSTTCTNSESLHGGITLGVGYSIATGGPLANPKAGTSG